MIDFTATEEQPLVEFTEFKKKALQIIHQALVEDIGSGDITTKATIPEDAIFSGDFIVKEPGIIAGLEIASLVFTSLTESVEFKFTAYDGESVERNQVVASVRGPARALLSGERTALNFIQRMSGIATRTRKFVDAIRGTKAKILDTRKTAPGLRPLDKWAVKLGGGENHRFGLYDMVLIKENHISAAGGITKAVLRAREKNETKYQIVIEVKNLDELREALVVSPDRILLDNMDRETLRQAVEFVEGRIPLEASGNITLENILSVAQTGVDYISVGEITHSVKALDVSFIILP